MKKQSEKFTGVGTVFISDVVNVAKVAGEHGPVELVGILKRHLTHVSDLVERYGGNVVQFVGDAVLAFWHPKETDPSHAQLAFDASIQILSTLPELLRSQGSVTYDIDIALGTGEMAGDIFGPGKRFQVVGKAMSIADRLSKAGPRRCSSIRMSQHTLALLRPVEGIRETGTIARDHLDDLTVFTYYSANQASDRTR